jgi:Putative peptidoglycan binding domain/OmpA family
MPAITKSIKDLKQGIRLPIGEPIVLTVEPAAVKRVRLVGMHFDLNKCFLLPLALPGIKVIREKYAENPDANLLAVGHTDTSGQDQPNSALSLERAEAVAAYLTDKAGAWEAFFSDTKPIEKRWGNLEVQHMLSRIPDGGPFHYDGKPNGIADAEHDKAVRDYQKAKGLKVDGIAGPNTRKALITDYMAIDGTSFPAGATLTTHGCGEFFPVVGTPDGTRNAENRRVEIFFFDGPIDPPPPGPLSQRDSTEYPRWLEQVEETVDVETGGDENAPVMALLNFALHHPDTDEPIAGEQAQISMPDGETLKSLTNSQGHIDFGQAPLGDYALILRGESMTVPAIPLSENRRRLRFRADVVQA